jgi:hypothetical protein
MKILTSEQPIAELAAALSNAQKHITNATRDSENPAVGRAAKYASLESIWTACRTALTNNGLSIIQSPRLIEEMRLVEVETILLHSSGQMISDTLAMPLERVDAWAVGSAITYARKYALASIVGVAPEDDDAAAVMGERKTTEPGEILTIQARVSEVKMPKRGGKNVTIKAGGLEFKSGDTENVAKAQAACDTNTEVTIGYLAGKWDNRLVEIAEVGTTNAEEPIL